MAKLRSTGIRPNQKPMGATGHIESVRKSHSGEVRVVRTEENSWVVTTSTSSAASLDAASEYYAKVLKSLADK